ncbi:hypothetical protein BN2475_190153 [Paraburkholderia ribeironis]|uniref:Uncharacterized protein n=1 Tax=Paraburkholderia ribeironis TaxID=1247936 RepID=A0A1N7RVY5_9BURK|nr:hypothetical protein BN2475_190153 [Paraburkholderia ribeironis]
MDFTMFFEVHVRALESSACFYLPLARGGEISPGAGSDLIVQLDRRITPATRKSLGMRMSSGRFRHFIPSEYGSSRNRCWTAAQVCF